MPSIPLWANAIVFAVAAALTWIAGAKLSVYAAMTAERTRFGQALLGALLLGGAASMPELVMSLTGAIAGDAQLAITTLLGGVPVTLAMVAICDALVGGRPVSSRVMGPTSLLHGAMLICLLALLAAAMVVGDAPFLQAGMWSAALAVVYVTMLVGLRKHEQGRQRWFPEENPEDRGRRSEPPPHAQLTARALIARSCLAVGVTAAAGYLLAVSGGAIAAQTGVGSTIIGMVLGGVSTSLPELSTIHAAVRMRRYEMAFADAFGSNLFSLMLIYPADLAYPGPPILNQADAASLIAALLGVISSAIYLTGLLQRARVTVLKLGIDSLLALCAYAAGLFLMYRLAR